MREISSDNSEGNERWFRRWGEHRMLTALVCQCRCCAQSCSSQRRDGCCCLSEQLSPPCTTADQGFMADQCRSPPFYKAHARAIIWRQERCRTAPVHDVQLSASLLLRLALARTANDRCLGRVCAGRTQLHGGDGARSIIVDIIARCQRCVPTHPDLGAESSVVPSPPYLFVLSKAGCTSAGTALSQCCIKTASTLPQCWDTSHKSIAAWPLHSRPAS